MTDANVTRIHPSPSIPNPFTVSPWASMPDDDLETAMLAASARVDAAEHTLASLQREKARRASAETPEHDPRCISLTNSEFKAHCDCETFRLIDHGAPSAELASELSYLVTPEMERKQEESRRRIHERNSRLLGTTQTTIPEVRTQEEES